MSERRGIIAVFVVVALVIGGGAYYFFGIHQPKQVRGKAQAEIEAWGTRWKQARECLLGPTPGSSKAGEALAIRELSPDPWSRGSCTQHISKLSRGEAPDTGLPEVETAWLEIDRVAGKVATAFITHVDPGGERSENKKAVDPLPAALDELDRVYASLREVGSLAPPPGSAAPALRPAEVIPLKDDADAVTKLEAWSMPSVASVIGFGKTSGGEVQVSLTPGAAPIVHPVDDGVLRTLPESAWGAGGLPDGLTVGPLDAGGAPTTKDVTKLRGQISVFAVVGTPADGLVVAGNEGQLFAIHSMAGKLTVDKPITIARLAFALDPAGRALIAFTDDMGKARGFVAKGGAPITPVALGDGDATAISACLTATRAWVGSGDQFVSFDTSNPAAKPVPHVLPDHELLGCTDRDALLHKRGAAHYTVCTESCRIAQLEQMRPSSVGTIAGDRVVGIATRGIVLGVWQEKAPPTYFALPAPLKPIVAISNGKVIDVVGSTDAGIVIARIPAK